MTEISKLMKTRLKIYLERNGIKAAWLAAKTGIRYDRVLRIINGGKVTASEAVLIATELRQPVHDLFEVTEVENPLTVE
jgi:hypothetical protein